MTASLSEPWLKLGTSGQIGTLRYDGFMTLKVQRGYSVCFFFNRQALNATPVTKNPDPPAFCAPAQPRPSVPPSLFLVALGLTEKHRGARRGPLCWMVGTARPCFPPPLPFPFVFLLSPSLPLRLAGLADRDEPGPLSSVCPSSEGMVGMLT